MPSRDRQQVVDRLAARIGLPVVLEDAAQQPLAHSPHHDLTDRMRQDTILRHATSSDVVAHFRQYGLTERTAPLLTPGEGEDLLPRWCVPLRHEGRTLGFLWVLLPAPETTEALRAAADEAATELTTSLATEDRVRRAESALVVDLLLGDAEAREAAGRTVADRGSLPPGRRLAVAVCTGAAWGSPAVQSRFWQVGWAPPGGHHLGAVTDREGISLCTASDAPATTEAVAGALQRLRARVGDDRLVVGVGDAVDGPGQAHRSHLQARRAAWVAASSPDLPVAAWADLGVERYLTSLPAEELAAAVDPRVRRLVDASAELVPTVERYLAAAGAIAPVAEALHIHRTTLYHRLEVAGRYGLDLRRGADRTVVDVGLRALRLLGTDPGAGPP